MYATTESAHRVVFLCGLLYGFSVWYNPIAAVSVSGMVYFNGGSACSVLFRLHLVLFVVMFVAGGVVFMRVVVWAVRVVFVKGVSLPSTESGNTNRIENISSGKRMYSMVCMAFK